MIILAIIAIFELIIIIVFVWYAIKAINAFGLQAKKVIKMDRRLEWYRNKTDALKTVIKTLLDDDSGPKLGGPHLGLY